MYYKEIIERLLSYPQRGQVQITFDLTRKIFCLSAPIYSCRREIPSTVKEYVDKRCKKIFKPYRTSFRLDQKRVVLSQEIPFSIDFQQSLRKQMDEFLRMSKSCHRMLSEMAIEEEYENAFNI